MLTDLAIGSYAIATATIDDGHPIVPAEYDPEVSAPLVTITAAATGPTDVTYA